MFWNCVLWLSLIPPPTFLVSLIIWVSYQVSALVAGKLYWPLSLKQRVLRYHCKLLAVYRADFHSLEIGS